jgi:hypothetical protein
MGLPVYAIACDDDGKRSLIAFLENWTGRVLFSAQCIGIRQMHCPAADYLKAVMEWNARSQHLGSEAGARIIHLNEINGRRSSVDQCDIDKCRVASLKQEQGGCNRKRSNTAHPFSVSQNQKLVGRSSTRAVSTTPGRRS